MKMEDNESIDYAAVFGVEEDTGPTGEKTGAGEEMLEQETAEEEDPSEDEGAEDGVQDDGTQGQGTEEGSQAAQQTAQHGAEDQQAIIDRAVQEAIEKNNQKHQAEMKSFFQKANLKNTITGEPITDMVGFDKWNSAFAAAKLEQDLKAGRLTPEALQAAIAQNPVVQQAQQIIEQQAAAQHQAERQLQEQQAKAILDDEIAKISQQDPSIRSVDDLMGAENYDQIYGMVKKGYKLSDAYKLVNFDKLTQKAAAASRQQVRNQALGKSHMSQTQTRGAGAVEVPRDIKQAYLELNPKATDAEIRSHYAKYIKK